MRYAAVVLSYQRRAGVEECVESLRRQEPVPAEILVWHNAPSTGAVEGCINIFSDRNFGCRARYLAALLLQEDNFLFVDDDVRLVAPDSAARILALIDDGGVDLVGAAGRFLADGSLPYTDGRDVEESGQADVVKGWLHGAARGILAAAQFSVAPEDILAEDDIHLSYVGANASRLPRVVCLADGAVERVKDGPGQADRPDHYQRRDQACLYWLDEGWQPITRRRREYK